MRLELDDHGGYIELLDESLAAVNHVAWVTNAASIARGKHESSSPAQTYGRLLEEAESSMPSRPFEFLPVVYTKDEIDEFVATTAYPANTLLKIIKWSSMYGDTVQTNGRLMYTLKMPFPKNYTAESISKFALFRAKVPMFSWAQIVTHTQLSTEAQSDRMGKEDDYWLPSDIEDKLAELESAPIEYSQLTIHVIDRLERDSFPRTAIAFKEWMLKDGSQNDVQNVLRVMGYKREIFSRAPYYFKMKEFVISGYANDDNAWPHFLRERSAYADDGGPKNWTQGVTRRFAEMARVILEAKDKLTKEQVLEI